VSEGEARQRLAKHRAELEDAQRELEPLQASWRESTDREVEELIAFAKERGHSWVSVASEEDEEATRRLLTIGFYGLAFQEGGPHHKAAEKVERLEGRVRWWENKVRREEYKAWKTRRLARLRHEEEE
jgi:hypothetical protein